MRGLVGDPLDETECRVLDPANDDPLGFTSTAVPWQRRRSRTASLTSERSKFVLDQRSDLVRSAMKVQNRWAIIGRRCVPFARALVGQDAQVADAAWKMKGEYVRLPPLRPLDGVTWALENFTRAVMKLSTDQVW